MSADAASELEVVRVLNNNAILATDRVGGQVILLGRGIGYGRHLGDAIDSSAASQVFVPDTSLTVGRLVSFLSEVPLPLLDLAVRLTEEARAVAGIRPSQALILALADHLQFAVERVRQGIRFDYPLRWEVAQLYPTELALGRAAVRTASEDLGVTLPDEEAVAFALHLVNAQFAGGDLGETVAMTGRILQVLDVVTAFMGITVPEDSMDAARFVAHLRYLFVRLDTATQIASSPAGMAESIRAAAPKSYRAAEKVRAVLEMDGRILAGDGVAYLAMHVAALYTLRVVDSPSTSVRATR